MEHDSNFISLALIFIVAFVTPIIMSKIKIIPIPDIILQILAGLLLGKSGFNLIKESDSINFLATLGFSFLMFLSGFEIDLGPILNKNNGSSKKSDNPLTKASLILLATILLSFVFSSILFYSGVVKSILLTTLIFSTTSLGIVVPTLRERNIINEPFGQTLLISSLFSDFSTLFLLPVVMFVVKGEMNFSILLISVLFIFSVVAFYGLKAIRKVDVSKNICKVTNIDIRIILAVLFMFAVVSQSIGVEIIVGSFAAGILFSLLMRNNWSVTEGIHEKLDSIGFGFLIPIFFVMIGVKFDLSSVFTKETLITLPVLLGIAFIVKIVPSIAFLKKPFGFKKALSGGFLLSSRLSLIIALSVIALKEGVITNNFYSTLVLVAIITCILSPIVSIKIYENDKSNARCEYDELNVTLENKKQLIHTKVLKSDKAV